MNIVLSTYLCRYIHSYKSKLNARDRVSSEKEWRTMDQMWLSSSYDGYFTVIRVKSRPCYNMEIVTDIAVVIHMQRVINVLTFNRSQFRLEKRFSTVHLIYKLDNKTRERKTNDS
ncbi:uncharacterized protein [Bombus flavifrons]|uniref:uncharacterized protein n=1 Tax=Bombus flavifrons TaxID=103934 RepID=UPI003704065B